MRKKILTGLLLVSMSAFGAVGSTNAQFKSVKKAAKEVGDKTEDVKDQSVKGAKKGATTTKKGVKEVGDKAEDTKDQSVKHTKKAASTTKKGTVEAGHQTKKAGKTVKDKVD